MEQPERFQAILKPYKGTPFKKVLPILLLLIAFVAIRSCWMQRYIDQDEHRRLDRERDRVR